MDDRAVDDLIRLYAELRGVSEDEAVRVLLKVVLTFRQAMAEHGVPPHPDGACPAPGCPCAVLEDAVFARACELLGVRESA